MKRKRVTERYGLFVLPGQGDFYYQRARDDGDWELLAQYIEEGHTITPDMRAFLAGVLRGTQRRKKAPPSTRHRLFERAWRIRQFVNTAIEDNGLSASNAVKAAAKKFRVTERTAYRDMRRVREGEEAQAEIDWQERANSYPEDDN
jgi:hypothetical protein